MGEKYYFKKLDAIRGATCFYILIHNLIYGLHSLNLTPVWTKILFAAGQEAVIVFFILSGFLVRISLFRHPDLSFCKYLIKRFRRIYFPLVISMVISVLILAWKGILLDQLSGFDIIGNFLLLQDFGSVKPGTWFYPFLGNLPLWSLSYEWWFYLLFYPLIRLGTQTINLVYPVFLFSATSYGFYILFPNQISLICSYFIIGWIGVEMANLFLRESTFTFKNMRPLFIALLGMVIIAAIPLFQEYEFKPGYYPFLMFRHFLSGVILLGIGVLWYRFKLIYFNQILGFFSGLAPISYATYVLSYPILIQWGLDSRLPKSWSFYGLNLMILMGLACLTERKWQPTINRWIK
jgi:peptidoglycan/LPS O-acetylase OafA/YrhL